MTGKDRKKVSTLADMIAEVWPEWCWRYLSITYMRVGVIIGICGKGIPGQAAVLFCRVPFKSPRDIIAYAMQIYWDCDDRDKRDDCRRYAVNTVGWYYMR